MTETRALGLFLEMFCRIWYNRYKSNLYLPKYFPVSIAISRYISYNVSMQVSDKQLIAAALRYNLDPGSLKCWAFALFDQWYAL